MKDRSILLPFGILFLFLAGIGSYIYDQRICNPEWQTTSDNLIYIESPNSITKIKLIPAYSYQPANLVHDTIIITETSTIDTIRTMLCHRYRGEWNHPVSDWNVRIEITMTNLKTFEFQVSKINNDKNADLTHMDFGSKQCYDDKPTCSLLLGKYLEKLTKYKKNSR